MTCRLQDFRWKSNLSQEQLSKKSGVPKSTICAIENNVCKSPQAATIFKLADALEVDVRELLILD